MIWLHKLKRKIFLLLYENSKFVTLTSVTPWVGIMRSRTRPISSNVLNINEIPKGSWWYSYINLNTKNLDFFMKILSLWPWHQGHPRGGDGADKNFRPISTIMPHRNEIHQRVFKIWGLINFNAKTLTLTFSWIFEVRDLDPKVTRGVGMVLIKTLDLYLQSCQIWMKSIKRSSKYEVL